MAITQYYVDPAIAGNSGTGTIGDPFGDLQYALDTVGAGVGRNATYGDQFNIKAGTAEILAASLTLATYGTPTPTTPLILRGYTAAANDGGVGEIDCGGATMWASTYDFIIMADLEIHTFGDNTGIYLGIATVLFRCEVHRGASAPNNRRLVYLGSNANVTGCYLHDPGTGTSHCLECAIPNNTIIANFIDHGAESTSYACLIMGNSFVISNIVLCRGTSQDGIQTTEPKALLGNVVYNSAAGTARGIFVSASGNLSHVVMNNIIVGYSGAGGDGIQYSNLGMVGFNAFYNNNSPYTVNGQTFINLTANDVALAADPFTNAAAGDFSLTAAAKTALASKGFPLSYFGAHASTVPNLNVGPIQLAATAPVAATRGRLIIPRR